MTECTSDPARNQTSESEKLAYVVDDQSAMSLMLTVLLRRKGYQVRLFIDPESALQSLTNGEDQPELLMTDFVMTPMNGMELIQQCKVVQPNLKTILFTGYSDQDIMEGYPVKPDGFLKKPFNADMLSAELEHTTEIQSNS